MSEKNLNIQIRFDKNEYFCKKIKSDDSSFCAFSFIRNGLKLFKDDVDLESKGVSFIFSTVEGKVLIAGSDGNFDNILLSHPKDFWNYGLLFSSKDFTSEELVYIEYYFTKYFVANDVYVKNRVAVSKPEVSEEIEKKARLLLIDMLYILRMENVDLFQEYKLIDNDFLGTNKDNTFKFKASNFKDFKLRYLEYGSKNKFNLYLGNPNKIINNSANLDASYGVDDVVKYGFQLMNNRNKFSIYVYIKSDIQNVKAKIEPYQLNIATALKANSFRFTPRSYRLYYEDMIYSKEEELFEFINKTTEFFKGEIEKILEVKEV